MTRATTKAKRPSTASENNQEAFGMAASNGGKSKEPRSREPQHSTPQNNNSV